MMMHVTMMMHDTDDDHHPENQSARGVTSSL